jgi:hypothetical protein
MFKSKKSLYFLVPFNVLLWGYVAFKVYSAFNEEEESLPAEQSVSLAKLKKGDSIIYKPALNYPDPFLKEEPKHRLSHNTPATNAPKSAPPVVQQKTVSNVPSTLDIKYLGLVENKTSGSATALISINGRSSLVKKGQVLDGLTIKSISSDRIEIKMGKENIVIQK